jgi:pterin-4a-carbinolamine dehydratase
LTRLTVADAEIAELHRNDFIMAAKTDQLYLR